MKKINLLITSLLLALLLTACGKKMVAKVTIDEMNVTRETLSLEFSVDDPKKQISLGTLEGKLYYKDNLINSYTPTKVDDTDFTYKITATNLSINHEYTIKVVAIANKRSVELLNKTFRTKHEGSSSANPIYIHTIEDFMDMENDNYAYYELVNDLDFTDYDFVAPFQTKTFQGSFDGKEKTLKNIKIDTRSTYVGIWGRNAGTIKNLNVENINVSLLGTSQSSQYISILAARNSGTIENVNIKSSSINTNFSHSGVVRMGGVSAYSESGSKIIGATVDIDYDIQAISRSEFYIGGIVGELNGASLKGSKAKTNIAMDNSTTAYLGGAIGQMNFSTLNESSAKESESELEINIKTTVERVVSNDKTVAISIGGFVGRAVKANFTDIYAKANVVYSTANNIVSSQSMSDKIAIGGFAGSVSNHSRLTNVLADLDVGLGTKEELGETTEATIKFDLGYNDDRLAEEKVNIGETLEEKEPNAREGYTFKGWYLGNELYDFDNVVNYSFTLVAQWEKDSGAQDDLQVVFDLGYDNQFLKTIEVVKGAKVEKPKDPVRNYYEFLGWYVNNELYDFDEEVNVNLALEARWAKTSIYNFELIYVGGIAGESYSSTVKNIYAINPNIHIYTSKAKYMANSTIGNDNKLGSYSGGNILIDDVDYTNNSYHLENNVVETEIMTEKTIDGFFDSEYVNNLYNKYYVNE